MKVKKLHPDAKIPTRAYSGDLGFDLYALEDTTLPAVNENGGLPVTLVRSRVVTIKKGERFAQLVPVSLYDGVAVEVEELSDTERGTGGFGSSDKGGE